jgi:hypothetical protein
MLFGIQASQDVKLSNIARSLQEDISLIKTEDRLSRNLHAEELETYLRADCCGSAWTATIPNNRSSYGEGRSNRSGASD